MADHPMLNYKPGLCMDTPITVTMAAADWAIFMNWSVRDDVNTEGVRHLFFGVISPQLIEALYTPASVKSVQAHRHEHAEQPPPIIVQMLRQMGLNVEQIPTPEDFGTMTPLFETEDDENDES